MKRRPDSTEERIIAIIAAVLLGACIWLAFGSRPVEAVCEYYPPNPPNEPTGVKGCYIEGAGIATHYGPGVGAAMNFCTWELRMSTGCGQVWVEVPQTGVRLLVPVVDYCDCFTGTADERIIDLRYDTLIALGLETEQTVAEGVTRGKYDVIVTFPEAFLLPNTAMETTDFILIMIAGGLISIAGFAVGYSMVRPRRR